MTSNKLFFFKFNSRIVCQVGAMLSLLLHWLGLNSVFMWDLSSWIWRELGGNVVRNWNYICI
jgi:hypothetical protein